MEMEVDREHWGEAGSKDVSNKVNSYLSNKMARSANKVSYIDSPSITAPILPPTNDKEMHKDVPKDDEVILIPSNHKSPKLQLCDFE